MFKPTHSAKEITEMLRAWSDGGRREEAEAALLPLVYDELHRQAHRRLRRERRNHTLQTSALINEAYLRLVEQKDVQFESRTHFFAIAANLMRQILIDYAKTKHRLKRGGEQNNLPLETAIAVKADERDFDLVALDDALRRLAEMDKQQVAVVELKFFAGLTLEEIAEALKISTSTVKRDWIVAKTWLYRELTK